MSRSHGWLITGVGLLVGAVAVLGVWLSVAADRDSSPYDPLPESVWSPGDEFTVLESRAVEGNECCEPNAGGRTIWLVADHPHRFTTHQTLSHAAREMTSQGWVLDHCGKPAAGCSLHRADLTAYVYRAGSSGPANAEIVAEFSRQLD